MSTRTPFIVGNWKMHPISLADAKATFTEIRSKTKQFDAIEVAIAAPFPYLLELGMLSPSGNVAIAAQNVFHEAKGAYTGEVSAGMLASLGVRYVIVGHSERRALGETDHDINLKIHAAAKRGLHSVLCIGEAERDQQGHFYSQLESQLTSALANVPRAKASKITIAYEPVWAIGSGKTPTGEDIQEVQLYIRKVLTELYDRKLADRVRVIYGGSVKPQNATDLFTKSGVDGFLPGGASLKPEAFSKIVSQVAAIVSKS